MNRIIGLLLILAACASLFLPFQEFESLWADFVFSEDGNILEEGAGDNIVVLGYELILPVFVVLPLVAGVSFSIVNESAVAKIIGFALGCITLILSVFLFIRLGIPAEPEPFSISRPPIPIIGWGAYLFLCASITSMIFTTLIFIRSMNK